MWVVNADLPLEYHSAGFVPQWLFDVMMLGKYVIFNCETDVVYRIGQDMQRLWRVEKEKDPSTVPFYHARLPVYSWMWGPVTTNMYQSDEHIGWTGTTNCSNRKVYPSVSAFLTPLSARGLPHCSIRYLSFFPSHLQLANYLTYSAGHDEGMQNKTLGGFTPLIHVLWYLDKFVVDCGNIDAVVVVDETRAMAAKNKTSDTRTKVSFLAVSAIRQKDLSSAVGGAL